MNNHSSEATPTFHDYYYGHTTGRGIWKWNNALDAYQAHLFPLAGAASLRLAEVGVQSGGSVLMWKAVLGPGCHVYGIDINKVCLQFADQSTTIVIGDQADMNMWAKFFTETTPSLDILVDDGGHQANQMLVTLEQAFPKINPGGFVAIEDIHGEQYVSSFFHPAASFLGKQHGQGTVASVHIYPYLLLVHKAAGASPALPPSELAHAVAGTVSSFDALWAAMPQNMGKSLELQNPAWGSLLAEATLASIFTQFGSLHAGNILSNPAGCGTGADPVCTYTVVNSAGQAAVTGVHVYQHRLVVDVAAKPPTIVAKRVGTEWIPYHGFLATTNDQAAKTGNGTTAL